MTFDITPAEQLPPSTCPYCGATLDAVTGVTGAARPAAGDHGLCYYCAGLVTYDADGRAVEPDEDQVAAMLANDRLMTARRALQATFRRRGRR